MIPTALRPEGFPPCCQVAQALPQQQPEDLRSVLKKDMPSVTIFPCCYAPATRYNRKLAKAGQESIELKKYPPPNVAHSGYSAPMRTDRSLAGRICQVLALTSCVALPGAAWAEFAVCNQSFDVVNVAVGQFEEQSFVTRGWWTIGPNQCANVIRAELSARYIYVFAQDVFGNEILQGTKPMCIGTKRFVIQGEESCLLRGYLDANYLEVDTQRTERWTLFLTAPP